MGLQPSSGQPTGSRPLSGQTRQALGSRASSGQPMGSRQSSGRLGQPQGRASASSSRGRGMPADIGHTAAAESMLMREPEAEYNTNSVQAAAAGAKSPVRHEQPYGHAAQPSQKRLISIPSPNQISNAPEPAFQRSQALSHLRPAGPADHALPNLSTAIIESGVQPASPRLQASGAAGGKQSIMGRAEAETLPTSDRPGGQPVQPQPAGSAAAGNTAGAKSRPARADEPAAAKQSAAATPGSTKGKGVSGTGVESSAAGSTKGVKKGTNVATPALAQV